MKRISQAQIAKMTGVSQCTVSRVLRGSGSVHIETREKVLAALRRNNYRSPEVLPVVVLVSQVSERDIYDIQILDVIHEELEKNNIAFEVIFYNNVQLLRSRSSAGILSLCYNSRFEREVSDLLSIPIVGINTASNFSSEIYTVCSDEIDCMEKICRDFFYKGHRRLGCLCYSYSKEYIQKLRCDEFKKQCKQLGIYGKVATLSGNLGEDIRYLAEHSVTGIIIASEYWSHDLQSALNHAKLNIPKDISLVSWGARNDCGNEFLNFNVVYQDYPALAREAVKLLMHQINYEFVGTKKIAVPYIYTQRGSVAAPHAGTVRKHPRQQPECTAEPEDN